MPRRRAKRTRQIRYSEALAREVCERIARGEVWSRIGGSKGMPDYSTIYYWRGRHPEFAEAYALARAAATESDLNILAHSDGIHWIRQDTGGVIV